MTESELAEIERLAKDALIYFHEHGVRRALGNIPLLAEEIRRLRKRIGCEVCGVSPCIEGYSKDYGQFRFCNEHKPEWLK